MLSAWTHRYQRIILINGPNSTSSPKEQLSAELLEFAVCQIPGDLLLACPLRGRPQACLTYPLTSRSWPLS